MEPNDIGRFGFEIGVIGGHVALDARGFMPARCHTRATVIR
jgi:hypothetical protein